LRHRDAGVISGSQSLIIVGARSAATAPWIAAIIFLR
jgi:hypothetical protein